MVETTWYEVGHRIMLKEITLRACNAFAHIEQRQMKEKCEHQLCDIIYKVALASTLTATEFNLIKECRTDVTDLILAFLTGKNL